jgi:hypothetical protein
VYVTTGNNYLGPATDTSDAFIALNGGTGDIVWKHQMVQDDVAGSIEADIGDSPQVYRLARSGNVASISLSIPIASLRTMSKI